jgi:hypothetical protein
MNRFPLSPAILDEGALDRDRGPRPDLLERTAGEVQSHASQPRVFDATDRRRVDIEPRSEAALGPAGCHPTLFERVPDGYDERRRPVIPPHAK